MDLNSLKEQVSNLTLYDLKAGVRKVQNGKLEANDSPPPKCSLHIFSRHELYRDGGEGMILLSDYRWLLKWAGRFGKRRTMNLGARLPHSCKKSPMPRIISESTGHL